MRRLHVALLAVVLVVAFVAGFVMTPVATAASADEPPCWWAFCNGEQIVCCAGQECCPQCAGDPPVCW